MGEITAGDVLAWRTLLEGPVDLLHIPTWPAPAKILVDPTSFGEGLRSLGRPVATYLAEILQLWATEYGGQSERKKELWDLACVAAVADPESVKAGPQAVPTLDAAVPDFTQQVWKDRSLDLERKTRLAGLMEL